MNPIFTKHVRPAGWYRHSDNSEWSASVAVVRGLLIKDGEVEGNIFVMDRSLPAKAWQDMGVMDEECALYILSLPQSKNPAPPVSVVSHRAEKAWRPTLDRSAPEVAFVAAVRRYIESDMGPAADEELALAFRRAARAACNMSR